MDSDATEAALGLLGLSPSNLVPAKRKQADNDDISCICGFSYDDGFSIACDGCSRWCHAACFDIVDGEVPDEWHCWLCVPRPVDKERAVRLQKARLRLRQAEEHQAVGEHDRQSNKRRASPGIERKQRRASTAAGVPATANSLDHKRKRRLSSPTVADMDESWSLSYVHIPHDIVPHQDTREKLRRQAQHWRGITALEDHQGHKTAVRPLPPSSFSHPTLSLYTNPSVRPPSYAVHTSTSIPSDHLITPYTSTIAPSSSYLSDPLNSYAHLGMPKPFVHLIGPPLDVSLDSRTAGNSARFVRNGCRPNAVLRPFLCKNKSESLSFGVFALRDIKVNEEVVLGWEWDDGHVVHNLPALVETPHTFHPPNDNPSPEKLQHIRNQMSNILHALSSTFTTCACGAHARDCAITQMAAFVDGEALRASKAVDLGPLVGARRGFKTKERVPFSGGLSGVEMCDEESQNPIVVVSPAPPPYPEGHPPTSNGRSAVDLSPQRVAKTARTQCPSLHDDLPDPDSDSNLPQVFDPVPCEDKMPPKMRKKWIHRESEALREKCSASPVGSVVSLGSGVGLGIQMEVDVDGSSSLPPALVPSDRKPEVASVTSPSSFFAQLSLVSPVIPGPDAPANGPWIPLTRTPFSIVDEVDSLLPPNRVPPHSTEESGTTGAREMGPCSVEAHQQEPSILSSPSAPSQEMVCPSTELSEKPVDEFPLSPATPPPSATVESPSLPHEEIEAEENAMERATGTVEEFISPAADVPVETPTSPPLTATGEMPTPKVKMSLRDFAIRKKRQREEEERFKCAVSVSGETRGDNSVDMDEQALAQVLEEEVGHVKESEVEGVGNEEGEMVALGDGVQVSRTDETYAEATEPPIPPPELPEEHPRFVPIPPVIETRQAKQELLEPTIRPSPVREQTQDRPARKLTHEDGEIPSTNGSIPPTMTKRVGPPSPPQPQTRSTYLPRSHTPPTQPRSFNASPLPLSPSPSIATTVPSSTSRRLSLPPHRSSLTPTNPGPSSSSPSPASGIPAATSLTRPVPSGPRALRAVNNQPPLSAPYNRSLSGPQYIPRGPSADRDRMDWERERAWQRSRVRGPGWGR
ncbi:hypothetical protein AX15_004454 [Amanita polypyramis BW_CC]|nr:hypothetical protein AX15_004454 [Amanita polypyramis BW_CC]